MPFKSRQTVPLFIPKASFFLVTWSIVFAVGPKGLSELQDTKLVPALKRLSVYLVGL